MYSNIVVGVDGRSWGCDAAALAASLSAEGARVTLVHACVINPGTGSRFDPAFELADSEKTVELMARERELCGRPGDAMSVPTTSVGQGLEGVATERGADLIVVGSCHRRAVGRVLLGDDAASVLHHARRPVAIAPAGFASQPHQLKSVGVAYDGTAESKVALAWAEALVESWDVEVRARWRTDRNPVDEWFGGQRRGSCRGQIRAEMAAGNLGRWPPQRLAGSRRGVARRLCRASIATVASLGRRCGSQRR